MQIFIDTKKWCEIQNNRGFLPTLEEINLIIENLNEMRDEVINTNVEEYNTAISKEIQEESARVNKQGKIKKLPKKIKWYVYLIKIWIYYKIWKTININTRFNKYITENPEKPELIHIFETNDYTQTEIELHNKFNHKNHNREWFKLDQEDILFIKNIQDEI